MALSTVSPPRVSSDIDAAVDVRADPAAIRKVLAVLHHLGFRDTGVSPEGFTHRFERNSEAGTAIIDVGDSENVVVDVLVPEGLAARTSTQTTTGNAFPAPGLTQALHRVELAPVSYQDRAAKIPRPELLGAIISEATAAFVDRRDPDRHCIDLAFLLGLLEDPYVARNQLTSKDRQRLEAARASVPPDHWAWRQGAAEKTADAQLALEILLGC
jgi:hypothetical protein